MTQLEFANKNKITPQMKIVAKDEGCSLPILKSKIKSGKVVIPFNKNHRPSKPCGIGEGLSVKVNVNLGTSTDKGKIDSEIKKLEIATKYKANTVMDLSVGGNLRETRKRLIAKSSLPFGTVPIYEAVKKHSLPLKMKSRDILEVLKQHAQDGVDFFTIHSGINKEVLKIVKKRKRLIEVVSRGGAIITNWMFANNCENPLFEYFDEIIDIAKEYDVTLSLGDGMRPGTILDATDEAQLEELNILGQLAKRAFKKGLQVMIEGPGHVPLNQIEENVRLQKKLCNNAPFYVLGPLVTDVAPGYDHITSAIGGAIAATYGADFLCFVTPAEHLRLPSLSDVKEGLIASRIAAHAADLARGSKKAFEWDRQISLARNKRDWRAHEKLSIDPEKSKQYRKSSKPKLKDVCTMCGKYCSIKMIDDCFGES